jgi:hypothetical protein
MRRFPIGRLGALLAGVLFPLGAAGALEPADIVVRIGVTPADVRIERTIAVQPGPEGSQYLDVALTNASGRDVTLEEIVVGFPWEPALAGETEGKAMVDDLAYVDDSKNIIGIELHIGWNRIVRRIFEALDYEVVKLDRVVYAGLDKKNIGRGEWRFLRQEEVTKLKHFN